MNYPKLKFTLTDGDSTKEITFNYAKTPVTAADVRAAGAALATSQGTGWTYVEAILVTESIADRNS